MRWSGTKHVLLITAMLACDPGGGGCAGDGPRADDPVLRPGVGRSFLVRVREAPTGGPEPVFDLARMTVLRPDGAFAEFENILTDTCEAEMGSRFSDNYNGPYTPPADPALDELTGGITACGGAAASLQATELCLGYRFMTLATAVREWGVIPDTEFTAEGFVDDETMFDDANYILPVQNSSDGGTLALVALDHFRRAALLGAVALDPDACPEPSALDATVPTGRADEIEGADISRSVTLGFVLASATQEAMERVDESFGIAREKIQAAARENLTTDLDEARARDEMWRGIIDSRLEIANIAGGVPWNLFNPPRDGEFEGAIDLIPESAQPTSGFITCADTASDPETNRLRDLIEGLRVDFRDETVDLNEVVRNRMVELYPDAFADLDASAASDDAFLERLGIDTGTLQVAAGDLRQEIAVQGRAIETDPENPALILGASRGTQPVEKGFLVATTLGAGQFDEARADYPEHRPTLSYAVRGNSQVRDYVASSVQRTLGGTPSLDPNAQEVLAALRTGLREELPMRAEFCVGAPANPDEPGTLTPARVRLYGVDPEIDEAEAEQLYELWLGEEGLECARTGTVASVPCLESDWKFPILPTVFTTGTESRLGATFLEWEVAAIEDLPDRMIDGMPHVYLMGRDAAEALPEVLSAFTIAAGDDDEFFTRCQLMPVGVSVLDEIGSALATASATCSEPEMLCGDLPYNFKLPLEDELTEATTGRDDIESSFARFLRLARESAEETDRLGEQLLAAGLEYDRRVEEARDELETICGGVVNVSDLLPDVLPTTCATSADCRTSGGTLECRDGVCVGSIADLPMVGSDPDLDALRRCLGASGLESVNLGRRSLCYYREPGGAPCTCTGSDCPAVLPECPIVEERDCVLDLPVPAPLVVERTQPLFVINREEGGNEPIDCSGLARIRHAAFGDAGRDAVVDGVTNQDWLYLEPARAIAERISVSADFLGFMSLGNGSRDWLSTGSYESGPRTTSFPCQPSIDAGLYAELGCDDAAPAYGRSLYCGMEAAFGPCDLPRARTLTAQRLGRAVEALGGITGAFDMTIRRGGAQTNTTLRRVDSTSRVPQWIVDVVNGSVPPFSWTADELGRTIDFDDRNGRSGIRCLAIAPPNPTGGVIEDLIIDNSSIFNDRPNEEAMWRCLINQSEPYAEGTDIEHPWVADEPETNGLDAGDRVQSFRVALWGTGGSADASGDRNRAVNREPGFELEGPSIRGLLRGVADRTMGVGDYTSGSGTRDFRPARSLVDMIYAPTPGAAPGSHPRELHVRDALDALELACLAESDVDAGCPADPDDVPEVSGADDFPKLTSYLSCAADRVDAVAERVIISDLPSDVVEELVAESIASTTPGNRGLQGETVLQLRAAFEGVRSAFRQISSALRDFAFQMEQVDASLEIVELERRIVRAETAARIARDANTCISSSGIGATYVTAISGCLTAAVDHTVAIIVEQANEDIADERGRQLVSQAYQEFGRAVDQVFSGAQNLSTSVADVNRLLAQFDRQKEQARRAAARALGLDRDDVGREYNLGRAMRSILSLRRERYEASKRRSIQMAWIARRAIEQRIGMDLSTIHDEDFPLVESPASWADSICTFQGIDYEDLRDVDTPVPEFADFFIGEYVSNLERFIDGYRFRFPFTDGDDTAVLSLRDDLMDLRSQCFAEGPNLFFSSNDLQVLGEDNRGWSRTCDPGGRCGLASPVLAPDGGTESPFLTRSEFGSLVEGTTSPQRLAGDARAFAFDVTTPAMLVTSDGTPVDPPMFPPPTVAFPGWAQNVELGNASYFVSWYERLPEALEPTPGEVTACETTCTNPEGIIVSDCVARCISDACETALPSETVFPVLSVEAIPNIPDAPIATVSSGVFLDSRDDPWVEGCRWRRAYARVEVGTDGFAGELAFTLNESLVTEPPVFAAPMLETVPAGDTGMPSDVPSPYFGTDVDGMLAGALCADERGERFRTGLVWRRGCEQVCTDGFGPVCESDPDGGRTTERCFHETTFSMSLPDIESGTIIPSGTLALGNFNYRHVSFGMNIVGTAVRDCSASSTPDTCFSSGFLPFSLRHDGPYLVRNHRGDENESLLFVGNVEYGKALVAERFLTNPVSSADRTLMQDFTRGEFLGRPLSGQYTLRIWDAEGFDWEKVEDVQILLNYRYWTRFE